MIFQSEISIETEGRGSYDLTRKVADIVTESGISAGLCQAFIQHTSASLMICENADPDVMRDLEAWMARAVPDGDPLFTHTAEGADDMPAHVRSVLTQTEMTLPVTAGRLRLGTWQGLFLWEHRYAPHHRRLTVTVYGD